MGAFSIFFKEDGRQHGDGSRQIDAKVYVEKSTGVNFKDVAGQDEAKEYLQEVVDFLGNPKRYTISEQSFLRERFSWDLREQVRHSLPRQ